MESSDLDALPPPILRLSADVWTLLADLLAPGDLIRLSSTGCTLLTSHIALGAETVNLVWHVSRYMDFGELFTALNRFKSVRELDFSSKERTTLYWMPVNWTLLPTSLVTLKLAFLDSVSALLQDGSLNTFCPRLEYLDLADTTNYTVYSQPRELNLLGLPETLRSLTLASARVFGVYLSQLETLPSGLETLDLDLMVVDASRTNKFGGDVLRQSQDGSSSKILFPRLPDSVTSLRLFAYEVGSFWHVDFASLPKALQKFEFVDMVGGPSLGDFESDDPRTYNLEGAATHLEHLHTLLFTAAFISPEEAINLIPSSVTKLAITIASAGDEHLKEFLETIAPRLETSSSNNWSEFEHAIFVEKKVVLPHLKEVFFFDHPYSEPSDVPPTVKHLTTMLGVTSPNLEGLETIEIYPGDNLADASQTLLSYSFGANLRELSLANIAIPSEMIDTLPNSLEEIHGDIGAECWNRLLSRMNRDDSSVCLPHLHEIANKIDLDICSLAGLPKQLKQLYFSVQNSSMAQPLPEVLKSLLPHAQLEGLTMSVMQDKDNDPTPQIIELFNILPLTLHTFNFASQSVLSPHWPVKLPPKLVEFKYRMLVDLVDDFPPHTDSHGLELPSSLQVLKLVGNINLPGYILPPYLSTFSKRAVHPGPPSDNGASYFARVVPPPNMRLQEYDYSSGF